MKRPILLVFAIFLPLLGGCIFPYVGPSIAYTPSVKLDVPREEVRAFRVDIASSRFIPFRHDEITAMLSKSIAERLSEVPISYEDEVPGQMKASVQYGVVVVGLFNGVRRDHDSVALRLYRPGYDLVEIGSWEGANRVEWKPAVDVSAQEKVIDRLFSDCFRYSQAKGSGSPAHREALLFGASEYERLAKLPSSIVWQPEALEKKAKAMRDLAAQ